MGDVGTEDRLSMSASDCHLVNSAAAQQVAEDGLGVQSSLVQVDALGLRHKHGAAHSCRQEQMSHPSVLSPVDVKNELAVNSEKE
jgi:hypothetical protein